MLYYVLLYSEVIQLYVYIYLTLPQILSRIGCYRALNRVPCANTVVVVFSVSKSCPTLCNTQSITRQAPLSMGFPRWEYRSRLPFPSPGIFPTRFLRWNTHIYCIWQANSLPLNYLGNPALYSRSFLSVLCIVVCIFQSQSPKFIPSSPLFPLDNHVCFLHQWLFVL